MTAALDHDLRRGRITSSTAAACLGLDPRCTPLQAWERIVDPKENDDPRMAAVFDRGHALEDAILEWGARQIVKEGLAPAVTIEHPPTTVHPTESWIADSCDALYRMKGREAADESLACGEAKSVAGFASAGWGETWTDEIPKYVIVQGHWHNLVHGAEVCYVPALVGFAMQLRMYLVERDRDVEQALLDSCGAWHHKYIRTGTPPPVVSEKDDDVLARLFPLGAGERADDPRIEALVRRHVSLGETIRPLDKERDLIGAQIKELLGDAELCRGPWGKASWKNAKSATFVDYAAVLDELRKFAMELLGGKQFCADLDALIAAHTITKPGSRRLITSIAKDK